MNLHRLIPKPHRSEILSTQTHTNTHTAVEHQWVAKWSLWVIFACYWSLNPLQLWCHSESVTVSVSLVFLRRDTAAINTHQSMCVYVRLCGIHVTMQTSAMWAKLDLTLRKLQYFAEHHFIGFKVLFMSRRSFFGAAAEWIRYWSRSNIICTYI